MKFWRHLLICALAVTLGGCGTTVDESLKIPSVSRRNIGDNKIAIILPFADYTYADNIESAYRRNLFINECVTDYLVGLGFHIPVQDDVYLFLSQQNIINLQSYDKKKTATVDYELDKEWSNSMKTILRGYVNYAQKDSNASVDAETNGLTNQEIIKIGRHFSADYIVRGRIIQFKNRQDPTWAFWKKGMLPFFVGIDKQFMIGQTSIDKYDGLDPLDPYSDEKVTFGDVPQAVVQVRIWIQDAYTGNVIWTNRNDVKISPTSFWADYQYDNLFETATEKAVASLMDDFAYTVYNVPLPVTKTERAKQ